MGLRIANQSREVHQTYEVLPREFTVKKPGQYLNSSKRKLLQERLEMESRSEYRRRIKIMLLADEGQSQTQVCKTLSCSQETARHWMAIAKTGQVHLWNKSPIGRPKTVSDRYLTRLGELVSNSPRDYGYVFHRWTAQWLSKHLANELGIRISPCHINRLLKKMGLSTRSKSEREKISKRKNYDNFNFNIRDTKCKLVFEVFSSS